MNLSEHAKENAQLECERLCSELNGVLAVVIASQDGFDIADMVTNGLDATKIAAMASSINAIGGVVSAEAAIGASKSITVKTEGGFSYIISIEMDNETYILNLVANNSAILAQVIYQCQETKTKLGSL